MDREVSPMNLIPRRVTGEGPDVSPNCSAAASWAPWVSRATFMDCLQEIITRFQMSLPPTSVLPNLLIILAWRVKRASFRTLGNTGKTNWIFLKNPDHELNLYPSYNVLSCLSKRRLLNWQCCCSWWTAECLWKFRHRWHPDRPSPRCRQRKGF